MIINFGEVEKIRLMPQAFNADGIQGFYLDFKFKTNTEWITIPLTNEQILLIQEKIKKWLEPESDME